MKRRKNIWKRKDGRYEGRYLTGYKGIYGKAIYRSVYAKTYKEILEKLEKYTREVSENVELEKILRRNKKNNYPIGSISKTIQNNIDDRNDGLGLLLKDWMLEWLKRYKKYTLKESSYTQYHSVVYKHLIPHFEEVKISELNTEVIQNYICIKSKKLAASTIKRHIIILSSSLKQAVKNGLLDKNPCTNIVFPKEQRQRPDVLNSKEYENLEQELIATFDNPKSAAILLTLKTGLRLGEIAALRWSDVDFEKKIIHIKDAVHRVKDSEGRKKKTKMIFEGTKSFHSERSIPMNAEIGNILEIHMKNKSDGNVTNQGFVFTNKKGSYIDPRVYQAYFAQILKKIKIRHRKFHVLRHTFATFAAGKNMQVSVLSRILGHANVVTTLSLYVHPLSEQDRIEMNKLSKNIIKISA